MTKKKRGFTLIELIVVIAIIGILLTIAIPRLNKYIVEARTVAVLASAKSIYTAVTQYELSHTREEIIQARNRFYTTGDWSGMEIDENGNITMPSLLDDYLDSSYKLVSHPFDLNRYNGYDRFSIYTYPFGKVNGSIAVYYKDPRMPNMMELTSDEYQKFWVSGGTAIIDGVPMVIGASQLAEELGIPPVEGASGAIDYIVPVDTYLAMYEEAVNGPESEK